MAESGHECRRVAGGSKKKGELEDGRQSCWIMRGAEGSGKVFRDVRAEDIKVERKARSDVCGFGKCDTIAGNAFAG